MTEEQEAKPPEITLYRCGCKHCNVAEEELDRLSKRYAVKLTVKRVEKEPYMDQYAGWSTPMVYVNGQLVSRYTMSITKWENAVREGSKQGKQEAPRTGG